MNYDDEQLVNNTDVMSLIRNICYLDDSEKKRVFNIPHVKNKLRRELLEACNEGDVHKNFRELFNMIDLNDFFTIFDYQTIHNFYQNHSLEYILFVYLIQKEKNIAINHILNDDNLFKEFVANSDYMTSLAPKFDYDDVTKMIYKMEKMDLISSGKGLKILGFVGSDKQAKLLDEKFKDETLIEILPYFDKKNISSFFEKDKRAIYLFDKFPNIKIFDFGNTKFNREILLNDKFFDKIKSNSFVDFRRTINELERNNDYSIIKKKLDKYYKELLDEYDADSGLFKEYNEIINNPDLRYKDCSNSFIYSEDVKSIFFESRVVYDENDNLRFKNVEKIKAKLKEVTNKKISEVVIDALFCDNIYYVWANIREMLRYNSKLDDKDKVLDNDKVEFYQMILDFDKLPCEFKINLFKKLYDKDISFKFYDELRTLKNKAYDMIKKDLIDLSKYNDKMISSNGVEVYDLRDSKYTMLVRWQGKYMEKSDYRRNCYSIISDENSVTYNGRFENDILYGYNSFDNNTVIHMSEQDSFSTDVKDNNDDVSRFVNRIMTAKELVNGSYYYSEIDLANLQDENGKYDAKKPDFIVVYDKVRDIDVMESKRLNIPIVIIKLEELKKENRLNTGFNSWEKYDAYDTGKKLR